MAASIVSSVPAQEGPDAVVPREPVGDWVVGRGRYHVLTRNADGTTTARFSPRPMHALDARTGEFHPFRNDLDPATTPGYSYESRGNGYTAAWERPSDVASGRPVMRIAIGDASLTMTAVGARPAGAATEGSVLTYTDAYPNGTDLLYQVSGPRVKETARFERAPRNAADATFAFELGLEGLSASRRADNSILFSDPEGEPVFLVPAPFMADSSGDPEGGYSDDIAVTFTELNPGKYRLEYAPSLSWLTAPGRVYPVLLDPTVEDVTYSPAGASAQNATVYEADPTRNDPGLNGNRLLVGRRPDDGLRRDALLRFPELETLPADSQVTSASLRLYAPSGTGGVVMQAQRNLGPWEAGGPSGVTWSTAPSVSSSMNRTTSAVPGWHAWVQNLNARNWVRGEWANYGVRLSAPTAPAGQTVYFDSSYGANPPELVVNYVPATRLGLNDPRPYKSRSYGGGNNSYVSAITGNLVFQHDGGSASMRGFELSLKHTYNSQDPYGQTDYYERPGAVYGEGWTFAQNMRLYNAGGGAMVFKDGSGGNHAYVADGSDGSYLTPPDYPLTLSKNTTTGAYTLVPTFGGDKLSFDIEGKLTKRENGTGDYLTYTYDTSDRLTRIADMDGLAIEMAYAGPGVPSRLSKLTEPGGRVTTYGYTGSGDLITIKHGAGTAAESTTMLNYDVAHHLTQVTPPGSGTSYFGYEAVERWDAASVLGGWTALPNTTIAQTAERDFHGTGALKLTLSNVTATSAGGAREIYPTPLPLKSSQGELQAFVWVPIGSQLQARLVLIDKRGTAVAGPVRVLADGVWSSLRLPDAHIDPGHEVKELRVEVTTPSGAPAYTGEVYLDHVIVKGVVDYTRDPAGTITARFDYAWDARTTTVQTLDDGSTPYSYVQTYDDSGIITGFDSSIVDIETVSDAERQEAYESSLSSTDEVLTDVESTEAPVLQEAPVVSASGTQTPEAPAECAAPMEDAVLGADGSLDPQACPDEDTTTLRVLYHNDPYPWPYTSGEEGSSTTYKHFPYSANGKMYYQKPDGRTFACSATAVSSENRSVVWTAAHCVNPGGSNGNRAANYKKIRFVPTRRDGTNPYGVWYANPARVYVPSQWSKYRNFKYDFAAYVVYRRNGVRLVDKVGGQGIGLYSRRDVSYRTVGYPGSPFSGERQRYCQSYVEDNRDILGKSGPAPMGKGCDLTPGGSGGGWFYPYANQGRLQSVFSFKVEGKPEAIYGPYQGDIARNIFNSARYGNP